VSEVYRGKLQIANKPRTLSDAQKRAVLEHWDHLCAYCNDPATTVDHIKPYSYDFDDSRENLVAACLACNLMASDKMFKNFRDKQLFLLDKHLKLARNAERLIWTREEIDELEGRLREHTASNVIVVPTEDDRQKILRHLRGRYRDAAGDMGRAMRGDMPRGLTTWVPRGFTEDYHA